MRLAVLAGMAAAGPARAGTALPTDPFGYAVFAVADATLAGAARVDHGDVGVNLGTLTLGPRVHVADMAAADTIVVKRHGRVGAFACNVLDATGAGSCTPLTLPLVAADVLTLVQVLPGALTVDVERDGPVAPLPPGDYGSVHVASGAQLVLTGGVAPYNVRDVRVGPRGRIVCTDTCTIAVRDQVTLAGNVRVGGSPTVAARFDVGGSGATLAFRAGPRAVVDAVVYAPAGTVVLGGGGRYTGAFVGHSVKVGPRAKVRTPAS
jgi:hypothetical protein